MANDLVDYDDADVIDVASRRDVAAEEVGTAEDDLRSDLRNLLTELESGEDEHEIKIKFYEMPKGGGRKAFLFELYNTNESFYQRLIDDYGTGTYMWRMYVDGTLRKSRQLRVRAPNPKPRTETPSTSGIEERMARLEELLAKSKESDSDTFEKNMRMMMLMREMFPQQTPQSLNMNDIVKAFPAFATGLAALKDVFGGGGGNAFNSLKDALGLIETAKGLVPDSGGDEPGLMGMLKGAVPQFMEMMNRQHGAELANPQQPQRAQVTAIPAPVPVMTQQVAAKATPAPQTTTTTTTPLPQAATQTEDPANMSPLTLQLMMLCNAAKNGEPVEKWANVVLDMLNDEQTDDLLIRLDDPSAFDWLVSQYHPVSMHRAWFEALKSAIIEQFVDEEPETGDKKVDGPINSANTVEHGSDSESTDGDTGRPAGDAGDAQTDEAARTA